MISFREKILARQEKVGLPIGDVVMAVLPDGTQTLVWGREVLAAIVQVNKPVEVQRVQVAVKTMAEADALTKQYHEALRRTDPNKVRENRLRRMALRQGLVLRKTRRLDPRAIDYGTYTLTNIRTNNLEYGGYGLIGLDEIETFLTQEAA